MPTTSPLYFYYYNVTSYNGSSVTLDGGPQSATSQLSDDYDGTVDGMTNVNDSVSVGGLEDRFLGQAGGGVLVDLFGTQFLLTNDNTLGGTIPLDSTTPYLYCYLAGTAIRTPTGERAVQELRRGDLVSTHDGRAVAVRWIGTQVRDARIARLSGGMPVRVRAGALGVDAQGAPVPVRDLCVSPDHALLVDGLLIHAQALVNGTSITRVGGDELAQVAYFHIETENHEIIVADGAPAETFIDNADRARFDNHAEWLALYPDAPAMRELPLGRVKLARQVPKRVAERLARIAAELPVVVDAQRFHRGGARVA